MAAVTVVVPTRNRPDLLALTLTSVLAQRDVDLRVIVVDDASTVDTGRRNAGLRGPARQNPAPAGNQGRQRREEPRGVGSDDRVGRVL